MRMGGGKKYIDRELKRKWHVVSWICTNMSIALFAVCARRIYFIYILCVICVYFLHRAYVAYRYWEPKPKQARKKEEEEAEVSIMWLIEYADTIWKVNNKMRYVCYLCREIRGIFSKNKKYVHFRCDFNRTSNKSERKTKINWQVKWKRNGVTVLPMVVVVFSFSFERCWTVWSR